MKCIFTYYTCESEKQRQVTKEHNFNDNTTEQKDEIHESAMKAENLFILTEILRVLSSSTQHNIYLYMGNKVLLAPIRQKMEDTDSSKFWSHTPIKVLTDVKPQSLYIKLLLQTAKVYYNFGSGFTLHARSGHLKCYQPPHDTETSPLHNPSETGAYASTPYKEIQ
jgi:hypothetical protein